MTEQNKNPEAVKPTDATPVPEKGNVAPIDAPKAPAAVDVETPAETEKERKQA